MWKVRERLLHFEFGFYIEEDKIEVIVIDQLTDQIRTLADDCTTEEAAEYVLETCIQYGFNVKGLTFPPIAGYKLKRAQENVEAV